MKLKTRKQKTDIIGRKYCLLPSKAQHKKLIGFIGTCRFLYNAALEHRSTCYSDFRKSVSGMEQMYQLPELKKEKDFLWIKETPSQSLQVVLQNLDKAFQNFFKKGRGYPRRKKKGVHDSITFPQAKIKIKKLKGKKHILLGLPGFKEGIKFLLHRPLAGVTKSIAISKKGNDWFISFSCDTNEKVTTKPIDKNSSCAGMDLGIVRTIRAGGKFYYLNIEKLLKLEKEVVLVQKRKAKTPKFSARWKYFGKIINEKHKKIARIRHDFLHKASNDICKNHTIVCLDDLNVKNMSKSASGTIDDPGKNVAQKRGLNRSILRQGWGTFNSFCEYKTKMYGGTVVRVNPKNTSRKCSNLKCGHISSENRKTQENFHCVACGFELNADINAEVNNKRQGLLSLGFVLSETSLEAPTIFS